MVYRNWVSDLLLSRSDKFNSRGQPEAAAPKNRLRPESLVSDYHWNREKKRSWSMRIFLMFRNTSADSNRAESSF